MEPSRRLKKVVIGLMRNPLFADMAGIFMLGTKAVVDHVPTACTNGRDELYGTKFVEMLDDKELAFVVVHESYHKMLRHLTTWRKLFDENPQLANMACVPEGTKVAMADGSFCEVQHVKAGSYVRSPLGPSRVILVTATTKRNMVELCLSNEYKLTVTEDHKVLTDEGFIEAGQVGPGARVVVDSRGGTVREGQLRRHDAAGYCGASGADVLVSLKPDEQQGYNSGTTNRAARRAGHEFFAEYVAGAVGLFGGYHRRRGDHNNAIRGQQVPTPRSEGFEHQLPTTAVLGDSRVSLDAPHQLRREEVLSYRSIGLRDRAVVDWDTSVFGCEEAVGLVAIGDIVDTERNAFQIKAFLADVGAGQPHKEYEYARVISSRRFAAEQRVYDLTTTSQSFEAEGVVVHNCDYVINLAITKRDPTGTMVSMPKINGKAIGLLDQRFDNMNAKQVFDILKQEQKQKPQSGDGNGNGDGNGGGFDEHDWDGAKEMTAEEVDKLAKEVDQAIRQGQIAAAKMHGSKAGGLDRELMDLLNPKVDWRTLLREFVSAVCNGRDFSSWRRPNRRFISQDIFMPSLVSERVGHMVIGIDTSGSIGGPELAKFLTEVVAIAEQVNPDKVDLIYWDAAVAGHEVYNNATLATMMDSTKPKGGGGTMVSALFDYVDKTLPNPPEVCIVLTDGYTPWPSKVPDYPVMFAISGSKIVAPFGKSIHMDD